MVQLMPLPSKTQSSLPHLSPDWFYLSGTSLPRLVFDLATPEGCKAELT